MTPWEVFGLCAMLVFSAVALVLLELRTRRKG